MNSPFCDWLREPIFAQIFYSLKEYLDLFIDQYGIYESIRAPMLVSYGAAWLRTLPNNRDKIGKTNILPYNIIVAAGAIDAVHLQRFIKESAAALQLLRKSTYAFHYQASGFHSLTGSALGALRCATG
ncbi:hypothetical protein J2W17_005921 [Pseudomonas lini]|uniref:hypothetical protein n=1 Tax=Pseudomonas lini TaxID=163011 RepID=UPI002785F18D|nr:hypothetical protein [Pseudomonas lini]MDQ0126925.1 hypothetical protein [Pseudomonas lini]